MQTARPSSSIRIVIALLTAMALLLAQWVGQNHRINHADLQQQAGIAGMTDLVADSGNNDNNDISHSCAAFDAATVGDSVNSIPFVTPLVTSTHVLALWAAFISWDAPVVTCFSSRAPPLA